LRSLESHFSDGPKGRVASGAENSMILASHVIISCYGFWLPNEEPGSWSEFVRSWELFYNFGKATKVDTHRSVANRPYDKQRRRDARESLKYPPVAFTGVQAREVAIAFGEKARKSEYAIYACAILRNHAHLVIGRHDYDVMQVTNLLKGAATHRLTTMGMHPLAEFRSRDGRVPSPWAQKAWKVFLDSDADVRRAIRYVEENPEKEGKRRQQWSFVVPYVARGW
jgi:REP element-mobilizing transposase RayT